MDPKRTCRIVDEKAKKKGVSAPDSGSYVGETVVPIEWFQFSALKKGHFVRRNLKFSGVLVGPIRC